MLLRMLLVYVLNLEMPVILKGGSEAINTNKILAKLFRKALKENKVNENFIQFVDSKDRKMVDFMLSQNERLY